MIKVGVLGCGFMGCMHISCYQALKDLGVAVTAVADDRPDFLKKAAEQAGAEGYGDAMELIEKADVDVIDICLPTHLHARFAVAAMERGCDVFCEKPACKDEADMEAMLAAQARTGRKVMIGQVLRFWDEYVWLKQTADSGVYGRVLSGVFQRVSSRPGWASGGWCHDPAMAGGVAVDMHVHDVDFVRWLLGDPDRVQASAYRGRSGMPEQIFSLYNYGKDVSVCIEAAWDYPPAMPFSATFRVKLEEATVVSDANGLTVYPNEGEPFQPTLVPAFTGDSATGGNISSLGGYYNELKYFVEGLLGQNDLSISPLAEAIGSVRLIWRELDAAGGLIN